VMGHAVPPERRAFQMSRRWIVMGLAQSLALPGVSWLFANLPFPRGYQLVFLANFAIAFWSFYCVRQIHIEKRIAPPPARAQRQPLPVQLRQTASEILAARPFLVFISGKMLYNLGLALVSALINIYWVKHLNFTDIWVGYMTMTVTVATLVSYLPWVRIKYRIGTQRMVVLSVLGSALYPALLSLARTPLATLPIVALNGVVGAGLNLAFFDALLEVCPPDKEARFVALNSTVVYLTGAVGPPVGAALLGALSIRWVMVISTLVALTGVAVFAFASAGERTRAA
jgi:Na+/melibiose symporter-like transporter